MLRDFEVPRTVTVRTRVSRSAAIAMAVCCCVLAQGGAAARGAQILLEPKTTGTFSWDWLGAPVNEGAGAGTLTTMTVGAYQKGTITRNYRSYMTFDTLDSQSSILSATLDLTISKRTIVSQTNPFSTLEITLGLPTAFTADEIANPQFAAQAPAGSLIYQDLATNGFKTISIPFGDVIQSTDSTEILISTVLPISFIAAFNQTRASNRFLTVSLFGGDYGMFSADMRIRPRLVVNNLTPVPEPMGWIGLAFGLAAVASRRYKTRRAAA